MMQEFSLVQFGSGHAHTKDTTRMKQNTQNIQNTTKTTTSSFFCLFSFAVGPLGGVSIYIYTHTHTHTYIYIGAKRLMNIQMVIASSEFARVHAFVTKKNSCC